MWLAQVVAACLIVLGLCRLPIWPLCIDVAALRSLQTGASKHFCYAPHSPP